MSDTKDEFKQDKVTNLRIEPVFKPSEISCITNCAKYKLTNNSIFNCTPNINRQNLSSYWQLVLDCIYILTSKFCCFCIWICVEYITVNLQAKTHERCSSLFLYFFTTGKRLGLWAILMSLFGLKSEININSPCLLIHWRDLQIFYI